MANDGFFVSEVNSDVRGENLGKLLKRYAWVLVALVVGVVGFVGYSTYKGATRQSAGVAQFNAIDALDADPANADAMQVLQDSPSAISALKQVQVKLAAGDVDGAKVILEMMSNNSKFSKTMQGYAKLQLSALNDGAGAKMLAQPGQPFALQAKLLEVDQLVANGQTDDALIALEAILVNSNVFSERAFVESLVIALGGAVPEDTEQVLPSSGSGDADFD